MERSLWAEGGLIKAPRTTIVQARGSYRYQNERTVTAAVRAGLDSAGKMTHSCSTESTGMTRSKDSSRTFLNHARREHVHQDDPFSFLPGTPGSCWSPNGSAPAICEDAPGSTLMPVVAPGDAVGPEGTEPPAASK